MKLSGAETYSFVWEWRTRAGTWKGVFVFSVDLRKPELLSLHFIGDTQIGKKKKKKREEIKCTNKCKIRHSPVILLSKGLLPWTSRCYHWDIPSNVIHIEIIYYEDNQYLFTSFLFLSPSAWPITSTQHTHTKSLCTLCCHPSSLPEQNQCSVKQYRPIEPQFPTVVVGQHLLQVSISEWTQGPHIFANNQQPMVNFGGLTRNVPGMAHAPAVDIFTNLLRFLPAPRQLPCDDA